MKHNFKNLTTKLFLGAAVCLLLIPSCRKTDFGNPIARAAVSKPRPASKRVPKVTPTPTPTVTTTPAGTTGVYDPNCECYVPTTSTGTTGTTGTNGSTSGGSTTCAAVEYPIWAGAGGNDTLKGTKVGKISYSNDGVNLYVTSSFSGPTCPKELHLWAGSDLASMPRSRGGVPFGQFPYKLSPASCATHTFTIPLSSLFPAGTTDFCNKNIYIVLHAAMGADATVEGSSGQTAIAYGSQTFGGPRWGWIGTYPVCCPQ